MWFFWLALAVLVIAIGIIVSLVCIGGKRKPNVPLPTVVSSCSSADEDTHCGGSQADDSWPSIDEATGGYGDGSQVGDINPFTMKSNPPGMGR